VSRWPFRVMISLNRATILGAVVAYLSLIVFKNKGYEPWRAKCDFDIQRQLGGRFLHPFISSCMF